MSAPYLRKNEMSAPYLDLSLYFLLLFFLIFLLYRVTTSSCTKYQVPVLYVIYILNHQDILRWYDNELHICHQDVPPKATLSIERRTDVGLSQQTQATSDNVQYIQQ
jgi:hypothetical protein